MVLSYIYWLFRFIVIEKSISLALAPTPSVDPFPILLSLCRPHLDTDTIYQLYTRELKPLFRTQLNRIKEDFYTLYVATYRDNATLHAHTWGLLMPWYGKEGGEHPYI